MHEYDVALKRILTRPGSILLKTLTGSDQVRWLNVETPRVRNLRLDLLGELPNRELIELELQGRNEKQFPIRMGEYLFAVGRVHGRLPRQVVLYVGKARLRMKDCIEGADFSFRFHLVDVRELDGEALLGSRNLGDNVIAVLTRLGGQPDTVRRILDRIASAPAGAREAAMSELLIVAGLRKLTGKIAREAKKMPILNDIMDNDFLGPLIRRGREEGRVEGREEGMLEGQREILLGLMKKRFGRVPPRILKRLNALNPGQIQRASLSLLDADRIDDLFVN